MKNALVCVILFLRDIPAQRTEPARDSSYVGVSSHTMSQPQLMDTHVRAGKASSNAPGLELRMGRLARMGRQQTVPHSRQPACCANQPGLPGLLDEGSPHVTRYTERADAFSTGLRSHKLTFDCHAVRGSR
jgi:hypothetical protein